MSSGTGHFGFYRAVVVDNADPQGQGRVRLRIPPVTGSRATTWAWPMQQTTETPAVGSGVFACFEGGDLAYPLWSGSFGPGTKLMAEGDSPSGATYSATAPASPSVGQLWVDTGSPQGRNLMGPGNGANDPGPVFALGYATPASTWSRNSDGSVLITWAPTRASGDNGMFRFRGSSATPRFPIERPIRFVIKGIHNGTRPVCGSVPYTASTAYHAGGGAFSLTMDRNFPSTSSPITAGEFGVEFQYPPDGITSETTLVTHVGAFLLDDPSTTFPTLVWTGTDWQMTGAIPSDHVRRDGDTMSGALTINAGAQSEAFLKTASNRLQLMVRDSDNRSYLVSSDRDNAVKRPLAIQATDVSFPSGTVTLSANPTAALQPSTKQYSDAQDALRVAKTGDTMTGTLEFRTSGDVKLGSIQRWAFDDSIELTGENDFWVTPGASKSVILNAGETGAVTTHASFVAMRPTWLADHYAMFTPTGHDMAGRVVSSVGNPVNAADAANKQYVDTVGTTGVVTPSAGYVDHGGYGLQVVRTGRICAINGQFRPTSGWTSDGYSRQIGTVPAGFRPTQTRTAPGVFVVNSPMTSCYACVVTVDPAGALRIVLANGIAVPVGAANYFSVSLPYQVD